MARIHTVCRKTERIVDYMYAKEPIHPPSLCKNARILLYMYVFIYSILFVRCVFRFTFYCYKYLRARFMQYIRVHATSSNFRSFTLPSIQVEWFIVTNMLICLCPTTIIPSDWKRLNKRRCYYNETHEVSAEANI